jgi:ligand-binding sensor domain-containing protein/two-component sensor histidine kinase
MSIRVIFIAVFLLMVVRVAGQFTHPPYRQYTLRDGLSQMQVTCILQDSRGYIWVGTKEGLNCFNGEKIISFDEKDGLINGYIQDIVEDPSGKIWFSTNKGVASFDGNKITSYPSNIHLSTGLVVTDDGKLWYAGSDHTKKAMFGYFEHGKYIDKSEILPVKSANFVFEYIKKENAFILTTGKDVYEFKDAKVRNLKGSGNEFNLIYNGQAILVFEHNLKDVLAIWEYVKGDLLPIANLKDGKIEIFNEVSGSFIFLDPTHTSILRIDKDQISVNNMESPGKSVCLIDKNNHLWLGSEEGLLQVFPGGFETLKREILPAVWSMVEDQNHNLWFASYYYGLKIYDGETFKDFPLAVKKNPYNDFYFQPQVDKRGMLYFPNNFGIFYTNGKSYGSIKREPCLATFYDKERDLLFGGYHKVVEVYDKNLKVLRRIEEKDGLEFRGYISSFGKDRSGNIWMGGFTGLSCYDWESKKIKNYNRDNGKLPSDGVLSIYNAPDGRTWFGGTHGLLWYNPESDSIRKVEGEELSGTVSFVTSIDSTWLVFSQSTGIYLMNLKKYYQSGEKELHFFNEKNGFLGIDPGQNGALTDSKGNIWMTSSTEVVKLDPKKLDFTNYFVNVRISHFNGERLTFNQEKISLPKNDRTAIVQFETICFNRPKAAQYSWRIDGEEHDWSPWQEQDYAVLTDLHDGKTQIQVKVRIPGLPNAEASTSLPLVVNLSVWKQEWFFPSLLGLVSLLVLLSIMLLFQTRMKMIQVNKQAKMFQLQAILSQMNPHFIFNVMASLQSMILTAKIEKANEYLVKMSNLIRGFLDASVSTSTSRAKDLRRSELPLSKELEILKSYIQFQQLIYPEKFDFELFIDPSIDIEKQTIPPMLIQPFVENSIRHGLLQKTGKGTLKISIHSIAHDTLEIVVADDGIGIQKASALMKESRLLFTSRGKELTLNRIKLLNEMGYHIRLKTASTDEKTTVTLTIRTNEA